MWQSVDVWGFLSGVGLFLFGMLLLEQGLRGLGSRSMKRALRERTSTPMRGVITGAVATAILQSSSLVGLIVLAFVGAGIIELRSALGVILGANLGTTLKGWLVAFLGFTVDFGDFAEPVIALGAFGSVMFARDSRLYFQANLLLGIGFILLGLEQINGAFEGLVQNMDVSILRGHNAAVYLVAGALFTAVIQSSSATMMILLSALHAQVIDLPAAAAVAIGADLGTTSTVLLGAGQGGPDKKRVALSHFLFNAVTALIAFLFLPVLLRFITGLLLVGDPLYALVMFHSLFNLLGVLLFLPFVDSFLGLLQKLVREPPPQYVCRYVVRVPAEVTEAAIEAARRELLALIDMCIRLNLAVVSAAPESGSGAGGERDNTDRGDSYLKLKQAEGELHAYTYEAHGHSPDAADARELTQINHAVRNIGYAAKYMKDIRHNLGEFVESEKDVVRSISGGFRDGFVRASARVRQLLEADTPQVAAHHLLELRRELRLAYEQSIDCIYRSTGADRLASTETASLLNANRGIYRSLVSLLEAVRVARRLDETPAMQTPEALLTMEGDDP